MYYNFIKTCNERSNYKFSTGDTVSSIQTFQNFFERIYIKQKFKTSFKIFQNFSLNFKILMQFEKTFVIFKYFLKM